MAMKKGTFASLESEEETDDSDSKNSFWLQIMAECEANSPNKLPSSKSLLILGEDDAQKTQLVAKLQGTGEKYRKGNGLEYYFLNVRDEYCENQTKLDIWVVDDDICFHKLLKYVLNENTISDTTVVLTASMTKPWDIFRSMCTWVEILEKHIKNEKFSQELLESLKAKVLRRYQEYVEPTMSIYGTLDEQSNSAEIENNLGLEVIVVITETEYMCTLQTEFGYIEEHFDFIQFSLRKFCLTYGAALFYVSVKEDRNCDILLKYILHKIYSFPFRIPAMFLEKDSIFVPAGWDSENKVLALAESLATIAFSSPFEDVIVKPGRLSDGKRILTEVEAQNDQEFLLALQAALLRQPVESSSDSNRDSTLTTTVTARNPPRGIQRSPKKKQLETKIASGEGDTVLQSFFKSLLKRQTSAPAERPVGLSSHRGRNANNSGNSSNFDRSTSLENTSSAYNRGNLESTSLGSSVDTAMQNQVAENLTAVDELKPTTDFSSQIYHEQSKKSLGTSLDPFSEFLTKYKAQSGGSGVCPELHKIEQLPEDEDKDIQQLPEYFMSNQSSNYCPSDCCFPNNTSSGKSDLDMDIDQPLDRVKSKFNPPLRLLLKTSHESPGIKPTTNGSSDSNNIKESLSDTGYRNAAAGSTSSTHHRCSESNAKPSLLTPDIVDTVADGISSKKDLPKGNSNGSL